MLATILETALRFVPVHAEAAEHSARCRCLCCEHHTLASEPNALCVLCGSDEDLHREPRVLVVRDRSHPAEGRVLQPHAPLCQTCWCATRGVRG